MLDYSDILYMHANQSSLKMLDSVYHASLRFVTKSSFRTHHCSLYESVGWLSLHNRRLEHWYIFFLRLYCTNCLLIYVLFWLLKSLPANVIFDHMGKSCMTFHERELSLVKVLLKLSWYKLQNHLKLDYLPSMTQLKIRIKDYLSTNAHVYWALLVIMLRWCWIANCLFLLNVVVLFLLLYMFFFLYGTLFCCLGQDSLEKEILNLNGIISW